MKKVKEVVKRYGVPIVGAIFGILSGGFLFSSPVNAVSDYDNIYHPLSDLTIQRDGRCPDMPLSRDYSADYAKFLLDESYWHPDDRNSSSDIYAAKESFADALDDTQYGTWGVSREQNFNGQDYEAIHIYWSKDPNAYLDWDDGTTGSPGSISAADNFSQATILCNQYKYWGYKYNYFFGGSWRFSYGTTYTVATEPLTIPGIRPVQNLFFHSNNPNFNYNYPTGYEGELIEHWSDDSDGDGLVLARESAQGTSNSNIDSDSDGISDHVESVWYPDREDIFCGTQCAYPDPIKKDIYVEIDWMKDPVTNRSFKPSADQLNLVKDKYDALNINIHLDAGQYGGGNQWQDYHAPLDLQSDYYDYKFGSSTISANFDTDRYKIWRYMVAGYNFDDGSGPSLSTGKAEAGGDDTFISVGLIQDDTNLVIDAAIAGTIVHELGHNLCLTQSGSVDYSDQASECIYGAIDNDTNKPVNYRSAMNYRYQFTNLYSYSDGTNGLNDHDDLAGIYKGMDDFQGDEDLMSSSGGKLANFMPGEEASIEDAARLQKEGFEEARQNEASESAKKENNQDDAMLRLNETSNDKLSGDLSGQPSESRPGGEEPSSTWILPIVVAGGVAALGGGALAYGWNTKLKSRRK